MMMMDGMRFIFSKEIDDDYDDRKSLLLNVVVLDEISNTIAAILEN